MPLPLPLGFVVGLKGAMDELLAWLELNGGVCRLRQDKDDPRVFVASEDIGARGRQPR